MTPEFIENFKVGRQDIHVDVMYFAWSSGEDGSFAAETFVIRDGNIVAQIFAAKTKLPAP